MTEAAATSSGETGALPDALSGRNLLRRAIVIVAVLGAVGIAIALAPGLDAVRNELAGISPWWLGVAFVFEVLSNASYVLMFRPIFCSSMEWKLSWQISWSEVGMGALVPASGIGGLALGAWVLRQAGMAAERIARRSVAFFLIKSSVNFILVLVLGACLALGLFGPDLSLWLTALPAAIALLTIAAVTCVPRFGRDADPASFDSRARRAVASTRNALVDGTAEAVEILRSRNWMVIAGSTGYFAWDAAVLWAAYQALDASIPLSVLLMGYLIGQLGGLLPLPGGIGGIEGGLIATLIVYGAPAAATAGAVLAYRVLLFWVPLLGGAAAFAALRRRLATEDTSAICRAAVASG